MPLLQGPPLTGLPPLAPAPPPLLLLPLQPKSSRCSQTAIVSTIFPVVILFGNIGIAAAIMWLS